MSRFTVVGDNITAEEADAANTTFDFAIEVYCESFKIPEETMSNPDSEDPYYICFAPHRSNLDKFHNGEGQQDMNYLSMFIGSPHPDEESPEVFIMRYNIAYPPVAINELPDIVRSFIFQQI